MITKNSKWSTALLVAAVPVLVAGSVAWVFPRETAAAAGPWLLPALSLCALVLALGLAVEWPALTGMLVVLAITLVLGWNRSSTTSTSHFAGACLGFLAMTGIGRAASTPRRLRIAMLGFLGGGLVVLLLGLAGASVRTGSMLDSMSPVKLPPIRLGLVGLAGGPGISAGDVNANALAAAALLVAPLGVALLVLGTGNKSDWLGLLPLSFAVVVTGAVTLAICHSRSAWIAIWLILVGLLVRGMSSWISRTVLGAIVVAPIIVATASVALLSEKAFVAEVSKLWNSVHDRAPILTQGVERLKESPWLGIGLNEFRAVYRPQVVTSSDVAHVHNIVLQTALDVGAAGSAAYWGVLTYLLVRAGQAARGLSKPGRSAAVGSALSLVAVTLFGLLDAVPIGAKIGTFQWMAGGLILAAWRVQSKSLKQSTI